MSWLSDSSKVQNTYGRKKTTNSGGGGATYGKSSGSATLLGNSRSHSSLDDIFSSSSTFHPSSSSSASSSAFDFGTTFSGSKYSGKPTPLKDVSGNTSSNRIFKPQASAMKTADMPTTTRRSKRGTETPLGSNSCAKISKSSPSSQSVQSSKQRGRKGQTTDVASILETGRDCDVNFLLEAVESTESNGITGLSLKAPKWSVSELGSLKSWLEALGFEESYFGWQRVFLLPLNQVDAFRRDVVAFRARRSESATESQTLGLDLDMEGDPHDSRPQSSISTIICSSSSDGDIGGGDAAVTMTSELTEEQLWHQETLGEGSTGNVGLASVVLPRSFQKNPRLNRLRCSFDSEECSSVQSTPSNASASSHHSAFGQGEFPGPDALSPTSGSAAPEMTRVLSGVTSGLHRLALQRSVSESLSASSSSTSLSQLQSAEGSETGGVNGHDDEVGSDTASEGEDQDVILEVEGAVDAYSKDVPSLMHESGATAMPMSLSRGLPPSSSSAAKGHTQKVWFGSVDEIQDDGDISPPVTFLSQGRGSGVSSDNYLGPRDPQRAISCDSPFMGTVSSRLSVGSDLGDPNPGFLGDWRRSSFGIENSGGKHLNAISHRRQAGKVPKNRMLYRSSSESAVHEATHSDAGSVTPGGVPFRLKSSREFSTPNSGAPRPVLSGEAGGYDWGTSSATNDACLHRLKELVDSYDIPPGGDFRHEYSAKHNALRRSHTMDDGVLSRPGLCLGRSPPRGDHEMGGGINIARDALTPGVDAPTGEVIGEMPQIAITPTDMESGVDLIEFTADSSLSSSTYPHGATLIDENIIAAARKALSRVRHSCNDQANSEEGKNTGEGMDLDTENPPELNERNRRRLKQSVRRKMRMSMGLRQVAEREAVAGIAGGTVRSLLSPATPAKGKAKNKSRGKKDRRVSPVTMSMDCLERHSRFERQLPAGDTMHEQTLGEALGLDERNFDCDVIGGVYQHAFDDFKPVVAPLSSAAADRRVVGVKLRPTSDAGDSLSLELRLFVGRDKPQKVVNLGPRWVWVSTAPDGYLVSSEPLRPANPKQSRQRRGGQKDPQQCYYLTRHPLEWADALDDRFHMTSVDDSQMAGEISFMGSLLRPSTGEEMEENDRSVYRRSLDDSMNMGHNFSPISKDFLDTYNNTYAGGNLSMDQEEPIEAVTDLHFGEVDDASLHDWDNSHVVSVVLEFLFDPQSVGFGLHQCSLVSKAWAVGSYKLLSRHLSQRGNCQNLDQKGWVSFMRTYNWGKFLSSGACKDVYMVKNNSTGTLDAVSVMDIGDLEERGMELAIKQEIEVALLCSSLVNLNICPNLVVVQSIFESPFAVSDALWRSKRSQPPVQSIIVPPRISKKMHGEYQYIRMEFCKGGDLEELMFFSIYACRDQLALRHYDVKLLNFFVTEGSSLLRPGMRRQPTGPLASCDLMEQVHSSAFSPHSSGQAEHVFMHVAFGDVDFVLPLQANAPELIKLSDFGTSSVGTGTLGDPITLQQLTTLENTPPEFLILGSTARQAYSADTFCLGLSMLHLLTGEEPYEVLLEEVKCPVYLRDQLSKLWCEPNADPSDPYQVLIELVESLDADAGEEEGPETPGVVLFDTLYRYLVLFSCKEDFWVSVPWSDNPVWGAVMEALGVGNNPQNLTKGRGRRGRASPTTRTQSVASFQHDSALWSIHTGTHPTVVRVQERLNELGGDAAWHLFDCLTHFDPARRCKMHEALLSPVFATLRIDSHSGPEMPATRASYCAYRRSTEQGGTDALHVV